jgi:exoribonuclease R
VLAEDAASLLPDGERPALLWCIDLDDAGAATVTRLERAVVRSRAQLTYAEVERSLAGDAAPEAFVLLREIGELRQAAEQARGGVSLPIPEQVVEPDGDHHYRLSFEAPLVSEGWNAQISLLTGIEAARIMLEGDSGLLRTLDPPDERTVSRLRRAAKALSVAWPGTGGYPAFVRSLDPTTTAGAALLVQATHALRGAGYRAFFAGQPVEREVHSAVAAPYAHVTAPLRRLCDRATNEIVLAHVDGRAVPEWALASLTELPKTMADARRREGAYSRAALDLVEALVLRSSVGETFPAIVVDVEEGRALVQLREPAVVAWTRTKHSCRPGEDVTVVLRAADVVQRRVDFEVL